MLINEAAQESERKQRGKSCVSFTDALHTRPRAASSALSKRKETFKENCKGGRENTPFSGQFLKEQL